MQYILVDIDSFGLAYQVVQYGRVVRYVDLNGVLLFDAVPTGHSSSVVDANPPTPAWHVEPVVEPDPVPAFALRRITKLAFVGLLGADFSTILTAAKASVEVELFVKMLDWATPEADGTSIDLDDPRVIYALNTLEAAGLIGEGRAQEILGA